MIGPAQGGDKGLGNQVQVAEREQGVVQLIVFLHGLDHVADKGAQAIIIGGTFGAGAGFGGIRKHQQGGFARTRSRTRVTEFFDVHFGRVAASRLHCLSILITGNERAMMFEDEVMQALGQAVLLRQLNALGHMADNGSGGFFGRDVVMGVDVAWDLVLDEEGRVERLADVVELRPNSGQAAGRRRFSQPPAPQGWRPANCAGRSQVRCEGRIAGADNRVGRCRAVGRRWSARGFGQGDIEAGG